MTFHLCVLCFFLEFIRYTLSWFKFCCNICSSFMIWVFFTLIVISWSDALFWSYCFSAVTFRFLWSFFTCIFFVKLSMICFWNSISSIRSVFTVCQQQSRVLSVSAWLLSSCVKDFWVLQWFNCSSCSLFSHFVWVTWDAAYAAWSWLMLTCRLFRVRCLFWLTVFNWCRSRLRQAIWPSSFWEYWWLTSLQQKNFLTHVHLNC